MPAALSALPQSGLEFIRDMAFELDLQARDHIRELDIRQGDRVLDIVHETGARVCEFVISPGPEAQLIVIAEQPGERHPLIGTIHDTARYRRHQDSSHPHRNKFASPGRPIGKPEAVKAVAHLAELARVQAEAA